MGNHECTAVLASYVHDNFICCSGPFLGHTSVATYNRLMVKAKGGFIESRVESMANHSNLLQCSKGSYVAKLILLVVCVAIYDFMQQVQVTS